MDLSKENMKKFMLLIVFTLLILVGLQNFGTVIGAIVFLFRIIYPFALGGAIAFIINIPMKFVERNVFGRRKLRQGRSGRLVKKLSRPLSLVIALILILAVIAIVFGVVVPQLGATIYRLSVDIRNFVPSIQQWGMQTFNDYPQIMDWLNTLEIDWEGLMQNAVTFLRNGATNLLGSTVNIVSGVVSAATNFVIAFVFAMYIVLQKERLSVQVRKIMYAFLPKKGADWINKVASLAYTTFSHFFTGQCLEAVILGTMFFIAMTIFRFPYALLVGILVAFTALIPIFGAFIGCVVGAFLILMENPMQAVLFVVMFLILQQIEGNLIYPHVVGSSVGLPSIWVLVAVTVGGSLMGIVGMLVFIPLMSVCYTLFRQWVYDRLKKRELIIIFKGEKKNETVQRDGEKQAGADGK